MENTEQSALVAEHIKKMTYRELYDLAQTLHRTVKSWEDDDDEVRPHDFSATLLAWADSVPSDDK